MDRNVEYILEVARCGGITRAAENLFITPSALSKYVLALEEQLQVKLFHRVGKTFVPTEAGECYIKKGLEIERLYHELDDQMANLSCISRGILRLGVQANLSERVLRFVLPKFQKQLPGIRICMHETSADEVISMLKKQTLDVGIAIVEQREHSLNYRKIDSCEMVMAVGVDHPIREHAEKKEGFRYPWIDLKWCSTEPNVMMMPGSSYRMFADNLYASYRLTPNIVYQFEATRTGLVCVAYNGAVMITADHMIFNSYQEERVVPLSIGETPAYRDLCVISSKWTQMTDETECLYGIMENLFPAR